MIADRTIIDMYENLRELLEWHHAQHGRPYQVTNVAEPLYGVTDTASRPNVISFTKVAGFTPKIGDTIRSLQSVGSMWYSGTPHVWQVEAVLDQSLTWRVRVRMVPEVVE